MRTGFHEPQGFTQADTTMGSVIQVMLCSRFHGMVGKNTYEIREVAERYGRERDVSSMWFRAIQEKWPYAYWEAEPSMQDLWPTICLGRGKPRDL